LGYKPGMNALKNKSFIAPYQNKAIVLSTFSSSYRYCGSMSYTQWKFRSAFLNLSKFSVDINTYFWKIYMSSERLSIHLLLDYPYPA